jgi:hypothetical protein
VYSNVVVAVLVLALICYRQLRPRPVRDQLNRIVLILGLVGVVETIQFTGKHDVSAAAWAVLVASLVVGAGFGALRGLTVHVWRERGTLFRRGNAVTVALWIVGLALHLGADAWIGHVDSSAKGFGDTAVLLYMAITLSVQQLVVLERAEHLPTAQAV